MKAKDIKKQQQLGMSYGTAAHQLRKLILFDLIKKAGLNYCHQCGSEIDKVEDLSIEHKIP